MIGTNTWYSIVVFLGCLLPLGKIKVINEVFCIRMAAMYIGICTYICEDIFAQLKLYICMPVFKVKNVSFQNCTGMYTVNDFVCPYSKWKMWAFRFAQVCILSMILRICTVIFAQMWIEGVLACGCKLTCSCWRVIVRFGVINVKWIAAATGFQKLELKRVWGYSMGFKWRSFGFVSAVWYECLLCLIFFFNFVCCDIVTVADFVGCKISGAIGRGHCILNCSSYIQF